MLREHQRTVSHKPGTNYKETLHPVLPQVAPDFDRPWTAHARRLRHCHDADGVIRVFFYPKPYKPCLSWACVWLGFRAEFRV